MSGKWTISAFSFFFVASIASLTTHPPSSSDTEEQQQPQQQPEQQQPEQPQVNGVSSAVQYCHVFHSYSKGEIYSTCFLSLSLL